MSLRGNLAPTSFNLLMVSEETLTLERHNLFLAFVLKLNLNKISYKNVQHFLNLPLNNYFLNMALLSSRYLKRLLSVSLSICLSLLLESSKSQYLTQHQQMVVTKDNGKFGITLQ